MSSLNADSFYAEFAHRGFSSGFNSLYNADITRPTRVFLDFLEGKMLLNTKSSGGSGKTALDELYDALYEELKP